jgi:hypothetical protein
MIWTSDYEVSAATYALIPELSATGPASSTAIRVDWRKSSETSGDYGEVLLLANHPKVLISPLVSARRDCGCFDVSCMKAADSALKCYWFLGILIAMQEKGSKACERISGRTGASKAAFFTRHMRFEI